MTKNLFLYINSNKNLEICKTYKDIYCLGDMIVAIDKNIYDRKDRFNLQKQFNVYPYYISQKIFKEILFLNNDIKLLKVNFIDESVEDTEEYKFMQEMLLSEEGNLYYAVSDIIDEFDTEIRSITFLYKSMKIELTNEGVLNFYSNESLLNNLVADKRMNNLLLGRY